jgi:hypothetical protein
MADATDNPLLGLWDARPWKDYATNPPSMAPQLAIALGLLGHRASERRPVCEISLWPGISGGRARRQRQCGGFRKECRLRRGPPVAESIAVAAHTGLQRTRVGCPETRMAILQSPGGPGAREQMRAYESYVDSLPSTEHPVAYQTFLRLQGVR